MGARSKPGVWCMEGSWSNSATDVRSVAPVLDALQAAGEAVVVRRHLNRPDDLRDALKRWPKHSRYRIGYLALHGEPETVWVGSQTVGWEDIERWSPGTLSGKVLHFGSFSVLATTKKRRAAFRAAIGARAVTGFTEDVEWFESLAFELLLFDALTHYPHRIDRVEDYLRDVGGSLLKKTGFVMVR